MLFAVMNKWQEMLENNQPLAEGWEWTAPEVEKINEHIPGCFTLKPMVYLVNVSEKSFVTGGKKILFQDQGVGRHARLWAHYSHFDCIRRGVGGTSKGWRFGRRKALLDQLDDGRGSVLPRIVKCGYKQLRLMHYFTAGEKEVRC